LLGWAQHTAAACPTEIAGKSPAPPETLGNRFGNIPPYHGGASS